VRGGDPLLDKTLHAECVLALERQIAAACRLQALVDYSADFPDGPSAPDTVHLQAALRASDEACAHMRRSLGAYLKSEPPGHG
jgi:hypothetical protein